MIHTVTTAQKLLDFAAIMNASIVNFCVRPECRKVNLMHHGNRYHQYLLITLSNLILLEIVFE